MIEEKSPTAKTLKSLGGGSLPQKLTFLFIFVVALFVILFASPVPFFSQTKAQAILTSFSDSFATYTKENGAEGKLSFGDIKIIGTAYEKKAEVSNFSLSLSHTPWLGDETLTVSSPVINLVPDPSGSGQLFVEFPAAIAIAFNGAQAYILSFPDGPAPRYVAVPRHDAAGGAFNHMLELPTKMVLNTPTGGKDSEVTITYGPHPTLSCMRVQGSEKAETKVAFQDITIAGPKTNTTIASLSSQVEHQPAAGGKIAFDATIALSDIGFKGEHGVEGPYSFSLSATGTRIAPAAGKLPPPDTDVTLRELSISADKFHLTATGTLSRKADDPLPFGKADVKVENFSSLRGSASLSPEIKALLVEAATHITGADASTVDKFAFMIRRDKLGQLSIGNSSFAELTTTILSRLVLGTPPASPAALAPTAAAPAPATATDGPVGGKVELKPAPSDKQAK